MGILASDRIKFKTARAAGAIRCILVNDIVTEATRVTGL